MFDDLFAFPSISFFDILLNVVLACLLGFFVSVIYRLSYRGYDYSSSFVNTLIILSMVTAIVIMVIGNNLARAFGLVGAMGIIRFRTALKDTRDIAFVFFALAAGMAAGAGNHMIGIVGSIGVGLTVLVLFFTNYGSVRREELLLRFFMVPEDGDENIYRNVFDEYLSDHTLLNVKTVRLGQFLELSFHVRLKNPKLSQTFIRDLSALEGLERISLVFG
ncbi:MAG: DUF4956 domain-containing protein, partial [Candidatus Latescibacterota bacterium]